MPLRLSNKPEIQLAQEWIARLHDWIKRNGLIGYDPFDARAHPLLRAVENKPRLRKLSVLACDLFPKLSRRLLRITPTLNPQALALVGMGCMRLHQITGDPIFMDNGLDRLRQLRECALRGHQGLCWGYPFARGGRAYETPANTPAAVPTAIAGQAFLLAHEITGDAAHLSAARQIAEFFLHELPRIETADENAWCFAHTMTDRRRIHHANLSVVEHVLRAAARADNEDWPKQAAPALRFSIAAQHNDGAWSYGEHAPGDPFEAKLLRHIDHHHTGATLRALRAIHDIAPDAALETALEKGVRYYRRLIRPDGRPLKGRVPWPVDIRACAEGIMCPVMLGEFMPGGNAAALLVLRWTHRRLRDTATGAPWHRKYPFHTARMTYPRWNVAWLYRALAEYLYHRREEI
ncbi:MAG TPA: hypothetical protein ENN29_05505 [Candidatus Hydrogenedentes bacterium]|nr:hypothetical protein [Candidatus Hydrogenedentota bacterium]